MTKRISMLAILLVLATMLAGCSVKPPTPWDDAADRALVLAALSGWKRGVEDFNVEAMAGGRILADGFNLTISEGGYSYDKDATQLKAELNADAANQAEFRESPTNYRLDLEVEWVIGSINQTQAKVVTEFKVFEQFNGCARRCTDEGSIAVELEKAGDVWKLSAMKITFDSGAAPSAAGFFAAQGFGLGKLRP